MFFGFAKQTEKQPKRIEFRFVSVRAEKKFDCFEDTLGMGGSICHRVPAGIVHYRITMVAGEIRQC